MSKLAALAVLLLASTAFPTDSYTQDDGALDPHTKNADLTPPILKAEIFPLSHMLRDFSQQINDYRRDLATTIVGHGSPVITTDGREIYAPGVVVLSEVAGQWTEPAFASFSGEYVDINPSMSPDGQRLYFFRSFEIVGGGQEGIYLVERHGGTWTEPRKIDQAVFSSCQSYQITESRDGTLYFGATRESWNGTNFGFDDVYYSDFIDGEYKEPSHLGEAINTKWRDGEPYVSPAEDYLIFVSDRPGGFGGRDLYISFRGEDGGWSDAVNMGDRVNSSGVEIFPMVSLEGTALVFRSDRESPEMPHFYWISTRIIEELRESNMQ